MDFFFELENTKDGLKLVNRKYKAAEGQLEKDYL